MKKPIKEEKIYLTGDMHFGHSSVIELSNRPFNSVEEMDNYIIHKWNNTVTDDDKVYILGDVWFKGERNAADYVKRLKGKKYLIKGNHDGKALKNSEFVKLFEDIQDIMNIVIDGERVILCHYPMAEWNGYFRGAWHAHGHIHNNRTGVFEYLRTQERALNAGVDINGFRPVTFQELKENNIIWKL